MAGMKYARLMTVWMVCLLFLGCADTRESPVFEGWGYPKGELIAFAGGLESALDAGDYGYVAQRVRYPLHLYVGDAEAGVIVDEQGFMEVGPALMDERVVKAVRDAANGKRLLVNKDGVVFGGVVWVQRWEDGRLLIVALRGRGQVKESEAEDQ
jgi:hypothetical protein